MSQTAVFCCFMTSEVIPLTTCGVLRLGSVGQVSLYPGVLLQFQKDNLNFGSAEIDFSFSLFSEFNSPQFITPQQVPEGSQ